MQSMKVGECDVICHCVTAVGVTWWSHADHFVDLFVVVNKQLYLNHCQYLPMQTLSWQLMSSTLAHLLLLFLWRWTVLQEASLGPLVNPTQLSIMDAAIHLADNVSLVRTDCPHDLILQTTHLLIVMTMPAATNGKHVDCLMCTDMCWKKGGRSLHRQRLWPLLQHVHHHTCYHPGGLRTPTQWWWEYSHLAVSIWLFRLDTNDCRSNKYYNAFQDLVVLIPDLPQLVWTNVTTIIQHVSHITCLHLLTTAFQIEKGCKNARAEDLTTIKWHIDQWYPWTTPFPKSDCSLSGFKHPECAWLLCPIDWDPTDEYIYD